MNLKKKIKNHLKIKKIKKLIFSNFRCFCSSVCSCSKGSYPALVAQFYWNNKVVENKSRKKYFMLLDGILFIYLFITRVYHSSYIYYIYITEIQIIYTKTY